MAATTRSAGRRLIGAFCILAMAVGSAPWLAQSAVETAAPPPAIVPARAPAATAAEHHPDTAATGDAKGTSPSIRGSASTGGAMGRARGPSKVQPRGYGPGQSIGRAGRRGSVR